MEWAWPWLTTLGEAVLQLFTQPFYYIAVILIALIYHRQLLQERRLFHVRLQSSITQTIRALLGGIVIGIIVSVISIFLGAHLTLASVICIWAATLILALFRIRYLCFAYAAGLLGVVQFGLNLASGWQPEGWLGSITDVLRALDMPALLVLAALLHLGEAMLVRLQGVSMASPLLFEGKRGKLVGGYQLQHFWPIPMLIMVPVTGSGAELAWSPLLNAGGGYMLMALPILLGFGEVTQSMLPGQKVQISAKRLLLYGTGLLVLSLLAAWWSPLMVVAALAAFIGHEFLVWYSGFEEQHRSPVYVHPVHGLKVLGIIPDSPAAELGIEAGETLYKVNGVMVDSPEALHRALRMNPAFCKLEVRNHQGESKFMQRAIYEGEHHQLGVLMAPVNHETWAVQLRPLTLFHIITLKLFARRKNNHNDDAPLALPAPNVNEQGSVEM
ncbi:PDZ domain-containing protein [Paenibacillus illinoisensis]|uniref:PDZ domain-containing protein n=1 Tax=Paenibacillus illinoisensis TaxID=59845 RepID=UPI001C8E89A1|nr:PDZ domain-containing protein [Paenibacillus illinoisensis]MBY0220398.1 PDZ domain-containing protein [Paenibacillus illinoisensis]